MTEKAEAQALTELMKKYNEMFDSLCQKRHTEGRAEYGQFTFINNDVIRMMMEELADTSNYCRMQFVKLMFLQEILEEIIPEGLVASTPIGNMPIGAQSFQGTKGGWNE